MKILSIATLCVLGASVANAFVVPKMAMTQPGRSSASGSSSSTTAMNAFSRGASESYRPMGPMEDGRFYAEEGYRNQRDSGYSLSPNHHGEQDGHQYERYDPRRHSKDGKSHNEMRFEQQNKDPRFNDVLDANDRQFYDERPGRGGDRSPTLNRYPPSGGSPIVESADGVNRFERYDPNRHRHNGESRFEPSREPLNNEQRMRDGPVSGVAGETYSWDRPARHGDVRNGRRGGRRNESFNSGNSGRMITNDSVAPPRQQQRGEDSFRGGNRMGGPRDDRMGPRREPGMRGGPEMNRGGPPRDPGMMRGGPEMNRPREPGMRGGPEMNRPRETGMRGGPEMNRGEPRRPEMNRGGSRDNYSRGPSLQDQYRNQERNFAKNVGGNDMQRRGGAERRPVRPNQARDYNGNVGRQGNDREYYGGEQRRRQGDSFDRRAGPEGRRQDNFDRPAGPEQSRDYSREDRSGRRWEEPYRAGESRTMARNTLSGPQRLDGGTRRQWTFEADVGSVQLEMWTEGLPLMATVEMFEKGGQRKTSFDVYVEDGYNRPYSTVLDLPRQNGGTILIRNDGPVEYPLVANVQPFGGSSNRDGRDDDRAQGW